MDIVFSSDYTEELDTSLFAETPQPYRWTQKAIADHIRTKPWVALFDGRHLVAIVLYFEVSDLAEILYLETLPAYHRQGCMAQLLSVWMESLQDKKVWLDVHKDNHKALNLYQKLGFSITGCRPGYYQDGGDALLLEKS